MTGRPLVYLIDGSGYIFRAYYAVRPLATSTGVPTHAVTGFARMLGRLLREERPTYLGIAFDSRTKNFRHAMYPDYKANRDAPPEDLVPQFDLTWKLVQALDIPVLQLDGFEADDVIATFTAQALRHGFDVRVVSGDKDLMQLVGDHVTQLDTMKGKIYDRAGVMERFGVPPERVADVLALAGDASDNIPGVPKVGEKTAAKLVAAYGDVEQVIAATTLITKPKAFEKAVVDNQESARLSKRLATLKEDVPLTFDAAALKMTPPVPEKIGGFLKSIEAFSLMRDLGLSSTATEAAPPSHAPTLPFAAATATPVAKPSTSPMHVEVGTAIDRSGYQTLLSREAVTALLAKARTTGVLSVDTETTSIEATRADIVGVSLAVPGEPPAYIPVAHRYLGVPRQLPRAELLELLAPVLSDPAIAKVGQNLKYDWLVFSRAGLTLNGIGHDTMIAAWVLNPAEASYSLDTLARGFLGHETIRFKDVAKNGNFDEVPLEQATAYAAEDADVALRLSQLLAARIEAASLTSLYRDLELPLLPVLAAMEQQGCLLNRDALASLERELGNRLTAIEAHAHALIGAPINLASPKQLAELFFVKLGYPVVKKTKTGNSTDQEVLETLARDHELPRVILEHRLLTKLKSTYVDLLPRMVNPATGRLHTSFHQTGTATGRLSSSDPNLQNIPIRTDDGRRIREAFVAPPGHLLISADYSQVELRVMAHLSQDPQFVEAFKRGEDIHARTAREVLTGGQDPSPEDRRRAKAINFGILYGLSEFGLTKQLSISRAEAHTFITAYFARYPGIRTYLDSTVERAKACGYVETLAGRRRFLPDLHSKNGNVRQSAERIAMNTPIQGTAADLIKLAMIRVHQRLTERRLHTRLLLQVHDELVLEAPEVEVDEVVELVRHEMAQVMPLAVPLVVDVGHGPHWRAAH